jgi:UDP-N-acetylglucosamine 1-carboxyvinyltransferase
VTAAPKSVAESPIRHERCVLGVFGDGQTISGQMHVPANKNTALPACIAAAICPRPVGLVALPGITDIHDLLSILRAAGARVDSVDGVTCIDGRSVRAVEPPSILSSRARGSVYALALASVRRVAGRILAIGGDPIAGRTFAPHVRAFAGFGVDMGLSQGAWTVTGFPRPLGEFFLDDQGVSASAIALLLASSLDAESIIRNASLEIEIDDLLVLLRTLGAEANRDGRTLVVRGPLVGAAAPLRLPPDLTVAGTFAVASSITNGSLKLHVGEHESRCAALRQPLAAFGVRAEVESGHLIIAGMPSRQGLVETGVFPALPADLQPIFAVLAAASEHGGTIIDTVYGSRMDHLPGLQALGATFSRNGNAISCQGRQTFRAARVEGKGIRESAALLLASLAARGDSVLTNMQSLWRGYEDLPGCLNRLGACISVSNA